MPVPRAPTDELRDLNRSTTGIPTACRITNIVRKDALILPQHANLSWMESSERTPQQIVQRAIQQLDAKGRGILLLRDIHLRDALR